MRSMLALLLLGGLLPSGRASNEDREVKLPEPPRRGEWTLEESLAARRSVRAFATTPLSLEEVARILWAAQGVTSREGFRTAPSAGATYPLETYLVAGRVRGLEPGIYRYRPDRHDLERIAEGDRRAELSRAALGQGSVAAAPAVIGIAAVYARTAGRYGARAQRYVHIEAGHAGQNIHLQATALGLGSVPVGAFDDGRVQEVLGLSEEEEPLYLIPVGRPAGAGS